MRSSRLQSGRQGPDCRHARHLAPHLIDRVRDGNAFNVFRSRTRRIDVAGLQSPLLLGESGRRSFVAALQKAPNQGNGRAAMERWRQAHLDNLLDDMTPMGSSSAFTFAIPDLDTTIVGTINPGPSRPTWTSCRKTAAAGTLRGTKHRLAAAARRAQYSRG